MNEDVVILNSIWFTEAGSDEPIGIVTIRNEHGEVKSYVGTGNGFDEQQDARRIADNGARLHERTALSLFLTLYEGR